MSSVGTKFFQPSKAQSKLHFKEPSEAQKSGLNSTTDASQQKKKPPNLAYRLRPEQFSMITKENGSKHLALEPNKQGEELADSE